MRSATERTQFCAADLTEASKFPNRLGFNSTCWLGGGQQGWPELIRRICATG